MINIAIIEDEKLLCDLQKTLIELKINDVDIKIIDNIKELETTNLNKYDIIIADYHINCIEIYKYIKEYINTNKKIIITSGDADFCNKMSEKQDDNLIIMRKPFDIDELILKIQNIVSEIGQN